ncbi:MAG: glycosyltransferase family 4 protein [Pseudomonadota bacterium]
MPETPDRLRVLVVAPHLDGAGLGEVYSIFKWLEALAERTDLTVVTLKRDDRLKAQLPGANVIVFHEPQLLFRMQRFNAVAKPWQPIFFARLRRWLRSKLAAGERWDIVHQILPQAMRYAVPLAGLGVPYVVGPLGGSLETPEAFKTEVEKGGLLARLRALDHWRLRHDRSLRRGYENADLVLGVAPYIQDTLAAAGIRLKRFEAVLERAHEGTFPEVTRTSGAGEAHLLHVGRAIRTKGLRDVIRALARLTDLPDVRLTSAGDGPDLAACKAEARALGVADRVTFLGRVPREQVDALYAAADVFCFPSFREPMGGVFFEAMEWGLPVITAARGGPDFILDDASALKLPVDTPPRFAAAIEGAIRDLANDPEKRRAMGAAAAERLRSFGGWPDKAAGLERLYREVLDARAGR